MSAPAEAPPRESTAALWGVLAVFLVLGTVGLGAIVYGLLGLLDGRTLDVIPLAIGSAGATLVFLFMAGILYRVDRYRGAALRRVELFE